MPDLPPNWGHVPEKKIPFGDRLAAMCAAEMCLARNDPDRSAEMIERLTNSLAFTIGMVGGGDARTTSNLVEGVTAHLYERATYHSPIGGLLEKIKRTDR